MTQEEERSDESAYIGDDFNAISCVLSQLELSLNGSDVKDSILVLLHVARCAMNHMGVIDARSLNAVAERAAPLPERR